MSKLCERFCENVCRIGSRWNFLNGDGTSSNMVAKMVVLEGDVLGTGSVLRIVVGDNDAGHVVLKNLGWWQFERGWL